jgi:hypothetical protein
MLNGNLFINETLEIIKIIVESFCGLSNVQSILSSIRLFVCIFLH